MTRSSGQRSKRKIRTDMLHFVHWKLCCILCATFVFIASANPSFAQQADTRFGSIVSGRAPRAIVNVDPANNGAATSVTTGVLIGANPARLSGLTVHRQQNSTSGTLVSTARSSIGVVVENRAGLKGTGAIANEPSLRRTDSGRQSSGPVATPGPAKFSASINGTGISRSGSGPGNVGGAAKNASAINGTSIRAMH